MQRIENTYNFRTKEINGEKVQRAPVSLMMELPEVEDIIDYCNSEDPKVRDLAVSTIRSVILSHVKGFVDDNESFCQESYDGLLAEGVVTFEAIANLPKADRNQVTKAELEAFAESYIAVMPELTGKSVEKVSAAAALFVERFRRCAGEVGVLEILAGQLGIYAESDAAAAHERAVSSLADKLADLMSSTIDADAL